ncbi:MlaD family protein [Gordonia malaquae]|jgi:phospholipid/cholesterol/gamma-HCH transport system substrate-binding protein|uniref:MlaD family protein n=1 Tax=Gordonia malaquae TaxID=410332 RepID=UPI003017B4C9
MKDRTAAEFVRDIIGLGRPRDDAEARRNQIGLGLAAVAVVSIMSLVLGYLYLRPVGYRQYTAWFVNSSGVRSGDQVRVAGITVGRVDSLDIDGDHVRVGFSVKRDVALGSETSIAVKLLTPVGGRFLQIAPKGDRPLGGAVIPSERVTGTYDLSTVLEHATPKAAAIQGKKLREMIVSIREGMDAQPMLGRDLLDTTDDLTTKLAARSDRLHNALAVSDEYVRATAGDREILFTLVASLGRIGTELGVRHAQVRRVFNLLKRLFLFLERPIVAYSQAIEPVVNDLEAILHRVEPSVARVEASVASVEGALATVDRLVSGGGVHIDQGEAVVTGINLCVPTAERGC